MSMDRLKNQLIQAARETPADDRVPYGFEMKVMREIASITKKDSPVRKMARGLWAACAPAVAVMIVAFFVTQSNPEYTVAADLALEDAVMTPFMQESEIW